MRTALIAGITGQDDSCLAELPLAKGYHVHGVVRRRSAIDTQRVDHLYRDPHEGPRLELHFGDLPDEGSIRSIVEKVHPDEQHTVADWVEAVFAEVGLEPGRFLRRDDCDLRPAEVPALCGDAGHGDPIATESRP